MRILAEPTSHVLADSTSYVDWASMGKILLISIAVGAGLVTVYSLGLLALSASGYVPASTDTASGTETATENAAAPRGGAIATKHRNVVLLIAAVVCLAIVVGAAVYGIDVMLDKG